MDEIEEQFNRIFKEGISIEIELHDINIELLIMLAGFYYNSN